MTKRVTALTLTTRLRVSNMQSLTLLARGALLRYQQNNNQHVSSIKNKVSVNLKDFILKCKKKFIFLNSLMY